MTGNYKILKGCNEVLVEIEVEKRAETVKAILVFNGDIEVWIPKSLLEDEPEVISKTLYKIIIPEWLAVDKNLV